MVVVTRLLVPLLAVFFASCNPANTSPIQVESTLAVYIFASPAGAIGPAGNQFFGVVLELESPFVARYASVDAFEMWRTSDGRRFGTTITPRHGVAGIPYRGLEFSGPGTLGIQSASDSELLGLDALLPGERLMLRITSGLRVVDASTVVTESPVVAVEGSGMERLVWWNSSPRAAAFLVRSLSNDASGVITNDTSFALPDIPGLPPVSGSRVSVSSLDANALAFLVDSMQVSSGLNGALGLVGSMATTELVVP